MTLPLTLTVQVSQTETYLPLLLLFPLPSLSPALTISCIVSLLISGLCPFVFCSDKTDKTAHSQRARTSSTTKSLCFPFIFYGIGGPARAVVNSHCHHLCCRLFRCLKQLNVAAACIALRLDAACLVSLTSTPQSEVKAVLLPGALQIGRLFRL